MFLLRSAGLRQPGIIGGRVASGVPVTDPADPPGLPMDDRTTRAGPLTERDSLGFLLGVGSIQGLHALADRFLKRFG